MNTECGISHKMKNTHAGKIHIIKLKLPLKSLHSTEKLRY